MGDCSVASEGLLPDDTQHSQKTQSSIPSASFEPAFPASEAPQTNAIDRATTAIGGTLIKVRQ